ncbi:MAG: YvcK family protein [Tissierellaceae bacterium]|nr:YvcK family protein [Tissierellaceae bacterium]
MENQINCVQVDSSGPKIVTIGGGTGLSILLRGIKKYTPNITAIVTVADDGGSSGVLREDLGMLAPGDIRSCLLALANTEPTMEKLLQYRFDNGSLKNHSFGNLFIAAMVGIYGSFEKAVRETSNVLAITGKVYPMTLEDVQLYAELENGEIIQGESRIPKEVIKSGSKIKRIYMNPKISNPLEETIIAIKEADLIVLGPGSLYTSVIPNLLVNNIVDKIYNAKAPKVYISNVMTQPGETDGFGVLEHVQAILDHSRDDLLDYVIANTEQIPEDTLNNYITDGSIPVVLKSNDKDVLKDMGITLIEDKLIDVKKNYIRHDNDHLSQLLMKIAEGEG